LATIAKLDNVANLFMFGAEVNDLTDLNQKEKEAAGGK
jgi:hypothetical protein